MFFRRPKPRTLTFDERLHNIRQLGFETAPESSGRVRITRAGCAVAIENRGEAMPEAGDSGVAIGNEIGVLVDGGYQKFFVTPSGRKIPAQAGQLKALHAFNEDLREGLGMTSLYNESLGTTSSAHLYDRVKDRDRGVPVRPWEAKHPGV